MKLSPAQHKALESLAKRPATATYVGKRPGSFTPRGGRRATYDALVSKGLASVTSESGVDHDVSGAFGRRRSKPVNYVVVVWQITPAGRAYLEPKKNPESSMPYMVKIRKKNPKAKQGLGKVYGSFGPFTTQKIAKKQAQVFADEATAGYVVTVEPVKPAKKNPAPKRKRRGQWEADGKTFRSEAKARAHMRAVAGWTQKGAPVTTHGKGYRKDAGEKTYTISKLKAGWVLTCAPTSAMARKTKLGTFKTLRDAKAEADTHATKKNPIREIPSKPARRNPKKTRTHKGHVIKGTTGNYIVEAYDKAFKTLAAAKKWIDSHVKRELKKANPKSPRRNAMSADEKRLLAEMRADPYHSTEVSRDFMPAAMSLVKRGKARWDYGAGDDVLVLAERKRTSRLNPKKRSPKVKAPSARKWTRGRHRFTCKTPQGKYTYNIYGTQAGKGDLYFAPTGGGSTEHLGPVAPSSLAAAKALADQHSMRISERRSNTSSSSKQLGLWMKK